MNQSNEIVALLAQIRDEIRASREQSAEQHAESLRRFESRATESRNDWQTAMARDQWTWVRFLCAVIFLLTIAVIAAVLNR